MGVVIPVTRVQIVTWVLASLTIILSIGRYVFRYSNTGRFYWDDAAHGLAVMAMIALCGVDSIDKFWFERTIHDYALHPGSLPPKDTFVRILKIQLAMVILFWVCLYAVKISLLLLYRNLFVVSMCSKRLWWSIVVFTVLTFWMGIAGELTSCGPIQNKLQEKPCDPAKTHRLSHAILIYQCIGNVLSDLAIMFFPMLRLPTLKVRLLQKLILVTIFSLALLVIAVEVTRTVIAIRGSTLRDLTALFIVIESAVAVMISCLPFYINLFRRSKQSQAPSTDGYRPVLVSIGGGKIYLPQKAQQSIFAPSGRSQRGLRENDTVMLAESRRNVGSPARSIMIDAVMDEETGLEMPGIAITKGSVGH